MINSIVVLDPAIPRTRWIQQIEKVHVVKYLDQVAKEVCHLLCVGSSLGFFLFAAAVVTLCDIYLTFSMLYSAS